MPRNAKRNALFGQRLGSRPWTEKYGCVGRTLHTCAGNTHLQKSEVGTP